ncbi:MAG: tetratricopeptide repeat protein, partial [Acidobacteria bacterium]|nr:tetratricopeptide repeat protein [Acidobacteriota bacterium]
KAYSFELTGKEGEMIPVKVIQDKKRMTLRGANNLALLFINQGNYAKAEPILKKALVSAERKLGTEHPTVAAGLENYAALMRMMSPTLSRLPWSKAAKMEARAEAVRAMHAQQEKPEEWN